MKINFIGCGNMATGMIRGILASGMVPATDIAASDRSEEAKKRMTDDLKIGCVSNKEAASSCDLLFLAIKPQVYEEVISEIKGDVAPSTLIISIAPGKNLAWLEEKFGRPLKFVRVMPNTPAMVGEGMSALCPNALVTEEELALVKKIFESFGQAEKVPEHLMDVVTAVSGSSPAYVFLFIEAMADAAVAGGMPREQAYRFAAQAVLGSAKMALETGLHPAQLKDMVCSPGGTTIEAVRVLEEKGFRSSVIEAELACLNKSRGM